MIIATLIQLKKYMVWLLELAVIVLFAVLTLDVLWGVLSRASGGLVLKLTERGYEPWSFLPRGQTQWTEEVAIYMMMWVALLGSAVAYGAKAHLGVDYFVSKLHPEAQRLMEVIVNIVVGFFSAAVMIGGGYVLVTVAFAAGQLSPALKLPVGYYYLAVPISGVFILLFCIENIVEIISGKRSTPEAFNKGE
jgi:TRAP-type C4-dicarboxylate transport system permease small subunit